MIPSSGLLPCQIGGKITACSVSRAWRHWRALWSGCIDQRPFAVFRIAWSASAILIVLTEEGRAPAYAAGRFHVPLWSCLPELSVEAYSNAWLATLVGATMTGLGLMARLGAATATLSQGYLLLADLLQFRNHVYLLCLLGVILSVTRSDRAWSLLNLLRQPRAAGKVGPRWPAQAVKGQIMLVYLWAAVNKVNPAFLSGWVLQGDLPATIRGSFLAAIALKLGFYAQLQRFVQRADVALCVSWFTVCAETFIAFCLSSRRLRWYAASLGAALHLTIMMSMNVFSFGLLMIGTYPLFVWGNQFSLSGKLRLLFSQSGHAGSERKAR